MGNLLASNHFYHGQPYATGMPPRQCSLLPGEFGLGLGYTCEKPKNPSKGPRSLTTYKRIGVKPSITGDLWSDKGMALFGIYLGDGAYTLAHVRVMKRLP